MCCVQLGVISVSSYGLLGVSFMLILCYLHSCTPITHSCNAISHSEISQDVVSCTRMIVPPFYVMLQLSLQTGMYCVAGGALFYKSIDSFAC